jgi:hypothetical protein
VATLEVNIRMLSGSTNGSQPQADAGRKAIVQEMKETSINDFTGKNVQIREDGRVMRGIYLVEPEGIGRASGLLQDTRHRCGQ